MKKITWGILAHVDAGKTTLSESMLFNSGKLREIGRVDHGDTFLDTFDLEKSRGITIFSKPATFSFNDTLVTLLDTPGHVDFVTETERALWVMDIAILLISAADGVSGHTKTLFKLLRQRHIPTVIFVNKIDQAGVNLDTIYLNIRKELSEDCIATEDVESIAMTEESAMEEYLTKSDVSDETRRHLLYQCKWIPVMYGSALKNQGVRELMEVMTSLSDNESKDENFGARVYKIDSLSADTRLSFVKICSGKIKVKDTLASGEKVDQIRMYSGAKYSQIDEASAGDVVALVGPKLTYVGQGLGLEKDNSRLSITPVLQYALRFLDTTPSDLAYPKILKLSEEDPQLKVCFDKQNNQILISLMGEVQAQILTERILSELGLQVEFVEAGILYKETLASAVEGVGHFEPLRHYAEVHVLMEPLEVGSGIVVESNVSSDELALNWQRLIETHIREKEHLGTTIGAPITDIKYTIVGGRAHIKHTEGGDFREATYRAIRQGFMEAGTIILEPYYSFEISLPQEMIGHVMSDIEQMSGTFEQPAIQSEIAVISGEAPCATIRNYQAQLTAFTKGKGKISLAFLGYRPCHNSSQIIEQRKYDPTTDLVNTPDSVFCSHGSAEIVSWDEVKGRCHVPLLENKTNENTIAFIGNKREQHSYDEWLTPDEIDEILGKATHNNVGKNTKKSWNYGAKNGLRRVDDDYIYKAPKEVKPKQKYLLVDGYNLIHAWPQLAEVLEINLDGARGMLLDILSNYKAMTDYEVIAVFDAYRVKGHKVCIEDYLNIHQVFTAEAQTADAYIEKFTHEHGGKYDITVVTSDGLEQIIIRGAGARLISSREFIEEVDRAARKLREDYDIK